MEAIGYRKRKCDNKDKNLAVVADANSTKTQ
jgi:hypothetical protein